MRIAFFTAHLPVPPISGYQLRCFHLLRTLLDAGHEVEIFSFLPRRYAHLGRPAELPDHFDLGAGSVHTVPVRGTSYASVLASLPSRRPLHARAYDHPGMHRRVRAATPERFDAVYMNYVYFMCYRHHFRRDATVLVDQHNLDSDVWRSFATSARSPVMRIFSRYNLAKLERFERDNYPRCDVCVSVSERDREATQRISNRFRAIVAPNGVDTAFIGQVAKTARTAADPTIVFVGGMSERNVDAILTLYERVFPRVRAGVPNARLRIAGTVCGSLSGPIVRDDRVEILGALDDIRDAYRGAWVFAAPFVLGGGTKLKMIEALAAGIPTVGSTNAFQGFDLPAVLAGCVQDTPEGLAEVIVRIIREPKLAADLAAFGLRMADRYDWPRVLGIVIEHLTPACTPTLRTGSAAGG
jgi:polysaccharide biosynthesis protein PslH